MGSVHRCHDERDQPADVREPEGEVEDAALSANEGIQACGPVVGHQLQECGDGGEERLHVEGRVKEHDVCHQAVGTGENQSTGLTAQKHGKLI